MLSVTLFNQKIIDLNITYHLLIFGLQSGGLGLGTTAPPGKVKAQPDEFIHIFVNQPGELAKFLEHIIQKGTSSHHIYNTLLELYLRQNDK